MAKPNRPLRARESTILGEAKFSITQSLQSVDLKLTLKAQPADNREKSLIFLKDMELTDYSMQPEKLQAVMNMVTPYLNQSRRAYFDQHQFTC
jgi:hypothetical protein